MGVEEGKRCRFVVPLGGQLVASHVLASRYLQLLNALQFLRNVLLQSFGARSVGQRRLLCQYFLTRSFCFSEGKLRDDHIVAGKLKGKWRDCISISLHIALVGFLC